MSNFHRCSLCLICFVQEDAEFSPVSFEAACRRHAEHVRTTLKINTDESKLFAKSNYCLIRGAIPIVILDIIEEYMRKRGGGGRFRKEDMFTKVVNEKVQHDKTRQLFNCAFDWVMFFLIATPVTLALAMHGVLHMVGGGFRTAKIVTYIVSNKRTGDHTKRHQAWHEDFADYLANHFGDHFGISVLVGCLEGSEVHIIPGTYGGKPSNWLLQPVIDRGGFETIRLERGECLVMGPGLVHRGSGYNARNTRLFLVFLGGRSNTASFLNTYNVEGVTTRINPKRTARADAAAEGVDDDV